MVFENLPQDSHFFEENNLNASVMQNITEVPGYSDDMVMNAGSIVNRFSCKRDLHEFVSNTCNLNVLPMNMMN